MLRRTQISLTESQLARLRETSRRTGLSLAELIRTAVDEHYAIPGQADRLRKLELAFGAWEREESGKRYVERVRSGTRSRLGREG
jgi:hypothetical protein